MRFKGWTVTAVYGDGIDTELNWTYTTTTEITLKLKVYSAVVIVIIDAWFVMPSYIDMQWIFLLL